MQQPHRLDPEYPALQPLLALAAAPGASADDLKQLRTQVEDLFALHHAAILHHCLRLCGDPEVASDLAQDTFLTAFRRLNDYRAEGRFVSWLHGIARYTWLRTAARKREVLLDDDLFDPGDPAAGVLSCLRAHERQALIDTATKAVLDPVEQEAIIMRYQLGMSVERITSLLGLESASGARGLLQRCRRKLRRELARRLAELGHGQSLLFDSVVIE